MQEHREPPTATEDLTIELLCRLSGVLLELESLERKVELADDEVIAQPERDFLRASLQRLQSVTDDLVSVLAELPLDRPAN